jgi:putative glycosyl hydrolase-like family 15 (GHL15) protein
MSIARETPALKGRMPVKPRWTDRALKGTALVVVSFLFGIAYASQTPSIRTISSGIAALNSGRFSGLTPSAPRAVGQSAQASTPGSTGGATSGSRGSVSLLGAGGNALTPASTASSIGLWAADWGGAASKRSAAGWEAAAHNDRILIGDAGVYTKEIPQLHAWNPALTVLVYNLGPYLQKGSATYTTTLAEHPTWFAHDSKGRLINLPMFPGNYLMDEGNSAYRAWQASQLEQTVVADGFDGAMVDSVGDAPVGGGHYASGVPVDAATGKPYTAAQYLANSVLMLNGDKAALGTKFLAFNGLISGPEYISETHILASSNANAGISELFLRQPTGSISSFPTATTIQDSIQMMTDLGAAGKAFLGWTKVWVNNASAAQVTKWEQFTLGVYLLGRQSMSYLDFMPSKSADNTVVSYANLTDNLGAPLGAYTVSGSTFTRKFANGTVTVSASSGTANITVT